MTRAGLGLPVAVGRNLWLRIEVVRGDLRQFNVPQPDSYLPQGDSETALHD